ncbi:MAG: hypothetical protein U0401_18000 [Anaerolineae bacterium]
MNHLRRHAAHDCGSGSRQQSGYRRDLVRKVDGGGGDQPTTMAAASRYKGLNELATAGKPLLFSASRTVTRSIFAADGRADILVAHRRWRNG